MSMAKQTNKALLSDKLSSLALGGSAAAVILLPQTITKAVPQLFTRVAPYTAPVSYTHLTLPTT